MIEREIDLTEILKGKTLLPDDSEYVEALLLVDDHCLLGEGIIFDDRKHTVLWSDILGKKFHALQLNYTEPTKVIYRTYDLPKMLGSFGLLDSEPTSSELPLLCAWEDGFQLYDIAKQQALSEMSEGEAVNPEKLPSRLNDGRVAPEGQRFICGGYYGGTPGVKMKVFKVEQKQEDASALVHEAIVDGLEVTNSINWSLDGKTMYLADSPTKQIHSYDYDPETGNICNKKLVHSKTAADKGVPDGSCVDAEGFLWNAVWKAGEAASCVQRVDPATGLVVYTVHLPHATSQVTCCCFGGEELDILFVTTASEGRDAAKEPNAGGLYAAKVPFRGRKENRLTFTVPASGKRKLAEEAPAPSS